MKNRIIQTSFAVIALFASLTVLFVVPVAAAQPPSPTVPTTNEGGLNLCTYIRPICNALGIDVNDPANQAEGGVGNFIEQRAQLILSLIFIGIVMIAVYIIITNGIKYIQSQGDEGKIKEAQKAIKTVFIGIAVLFIGIAGLVLVLVALNATNLLNQDSEGCRVNPLTGIITCPEDPEV